ncbi:hypothetical protein FQN52_004522 [Onygenales sp. PD_12]|nr:hypothetical protein FQN52_004522 [Onygenales sp. PD_12]
MIHDSKKAALMILNMFDCDITHLIDGINIDRPLNAISHPFWQLKRSSSDTDSSLMNFTWFLKIGDNKLTYLKTNGSKYHCSLGTNPKLLLRYTLWVLKIVKSLMKHLINSMNKDVCLG